MISWRFIGLRSISHLSSSSDAIFAVNIPMFALYLVQSFLKVKLFLTDVCLVSSTKLSKVKLFLTDVSLASSTKLSKVKLFLTDVSLASSTKLSKSQTFSDRCFPCL